MGDCVWDLEIQNAGLYDIDDFFHDGHLGENGKETAAGSYPAAVIGKLIGEIKLLNLWEGDKYFLDLLINRKDFFTMKLTYNKDKLVEVMVDGVLLEI